MKAYTDNPLASVIVPNYNHSKYLPERLSSIINQSFQDFELIILDDASTDNSLEIISGCIGNLPHRLIANKENSGSPFKQWDKGISLAKGELIWIAESDDVAEPTLLEKAVRKLLDSETVFAYCQSLIIDSDDNVTGNVKGWTDEYDPILWNNDFIMDGVKFCSNFLAIKCVIPNASAVVFRRKFYINPLTILPHLTLAGDYLFWAHLAMQGSVAYIAEPLNKFRRHGSTARVSRGGQITLRKPLMLRHGSLRKLMPMARGLLLILYGAICLIYGPVSAWNPRRRLIGFREKRPMRSCISCTGSAFSLLYYRISQRALLEY